MLDRMVMYCSYFCYGGQQGNYWRLSFASKKPDSYIQRIGNFEQQKLLPKEATQLLSLFLNYGD
jgi:hypothetical protein